MTAPTAPSLAQNPASRSQRRAWQVVVPQLSGNATRLFLTSATILFVELAAHPLDPRQRRATSASSATSCSWPASSASASASCWAEAGAASPILPFALLLLAVVILVYRAQLERPGRSRPTSSSSGSPRVRSADVNFLVLPLVVVLVTGLLAALATPLGPLLRSMAPLRAYAIDIIGSMCGIAVFVTLSAPRGRTRSSGSAFAVFLVLLMELGAGFIGLVARERGGPRRRAPPRQPRPRTGQRALRHLVARTTGST